MRKLFAILCLFALALGFIAGEKRVVGTKINNQIMLLRVDLANYAMDASTDGVTWSAIPGTSGAALLSGADFTGNVSIAGTTTLSGLTATTVPYLDASKIMTSSAVTPTELGYLSGVTSAIQTQLGAKAASGANSDITSLTGLTTALSITQGGTGLSALGTAGQVLTVNSGATAAEWATPSSGIDLSSYGSSYDGHYTRFSYSSGGIDSYVKQLFHFDSSSADATGNVTSFLTGGTCTYPSGKFSNASSTDGYYLGWLMDMTRDIFSISTPMTWDFWIKPTSVVTDGNDYDNIITQYNDSYWSWLWFHLTSDYKMEVYYQYRNNTYIKKSTPVQLSQDSWQHVAVVHEGGGIVKVYVNGTLSSTDTFDYFEMSNNSGTWGPGECMIIGSRRFGASFGGFLDEARISHGIARWTSDFTPPAAPYSTTETRALYVDSSLPPYVTAPSSPAQGDILFYDGSAWAKLAAGTSGQYLQTQGASANPQWATVTGTGGLLKESGSGYALDNGSTGRGTVGTKSVSLEYSNTGSGYGATGDYAFSIGEKTAAHNPGSFSGGIESNSIHYAEFSYASGGWVSEPAGGCQKGFVQARTSSTGTDAVVLYLDGPSSNYEKFTLYSGDHYSCRVHLIGAQADGSTGDYYALVKIKNVSGTTSLSGTVRVLEAWEGDTNLGTPTIAITADDTNDCLQIAVTPANTTATRWSATIEYIKINY